MKRIFVTLAVLSTGLLLAAFVMGWMIGDLTRRDAEVQAGFDLHFLTAVAGLMFASLVHAIVLTYFMGTGRWMEETGNVYRLSDEWRAESQRLKYRTFPWMAGALVMLILTGAFGAIADPATLGTEGWGGVSAATVHFLVASIAVAANILINVMEYQAIGRNSQLVENVLAEVRRIRQEKGLPISF
ncbi:MAG: hypothetical protein IID45_00100 [Planctomycetes bacterium]|nr:hypothetical protein [Planctomycetota bacterium]